MFMIFDYVMLYVYGTINLALELNMISTLKFIPAHVFTHQLITKHEKRITRLKSSNEKQ
jgi:hypothetical protein